MVVIVTMTAACDIKHPVKQQNIGLQKMLARLLWIIEAGAVSWHCSPRVGFTCRRRERIKGHKYRSKDVRAGCHRETPGIESWVQFHKFSPTDIRLFNEAGYAVWLMNRAAALLRGSTSIYREKKEKGETLSGEWEQMWGLRNDDGERALLGLLELFCREKLVMLKN